METIQVILTGLSLLTSFGTACVMVYGFGKFLAKPHNSLEERVKTLELQHKEITQSLYKGNDKFREQEKTNEVIIIALSALIDFEVHYCETEQKPISKSLERAKDDLHRFLEQK